MRKLHRILSLMICLILVCSVSTPVFAATDKLILIANVQDLLDFAQACRLDSYSTNITVILSANLDLSDAEFVSIPIFAGTFNGNGHHITGVSLAPQGSGYGFFRYLTATATVKDLHIEGTVTPSGSASDIGGLAGFNAGHIQNCSFTGNVSGNNRIGGIAGNNALTGILEGCTAGGSVNGNHFSGGITGSNAGVVRNCTNHAHINTIITQNSVELSDITLDSLTESEFAATITDIGGICGTGTGVIRGCQNNGNVGYPKIGYNIGGIAGSYSGYISDCDNHGSIHGRKEVGGILGQLEPAVHVLYSVDTIQTLQAQMDEMSAIADSAGGHMQNGVDALGTFTDQLEQQVDSAQDALELLIPDPNNPALPDRDTLEAAQNALSSSLSGITGALNTMLTSGMASFSGLTQSIQGITTQVNEIGSTIGTAADNLGGSIVDISDSDTPQDLTAKLSSCKNMGSIQGDLNVGGIVGAIAPENDLDPESDLQLIGNSSLSFDIQLRAVISNCENAGAIQGSKHNIGGIAGWASMGLLKGCVNTASVEAPEADRIGGIAGQSLGFIRQCGAKCAIAGDSYVGGIAGMGATVTDCHAIIQLEAVKEKYGAILGSLENATPKNNYYLPTTRDYGAVDGISYSNMAEPLPHDRFFALDDLPGSFRLVNITFVYNDSTQQRYSLPYGTALSAIDFPTLPEIQGYECYWDGPLHLDDAVTFDVTFTAVYPSHIYTLETALTGRDGLPILLLQGEFLYSDTIEAEEMNEAGYAASWSFTLPDSVTQMTLRCLLPGEFSSEEISVELRHSDGSWKESEATVQGSYLVMPVLQDVNGLRLVHTPASNWTWLLLAAATVLLLILVVLLIIGHKRKKRKQANKC